MDTSGFYRYNEEEATWWYAPNQVYHKNYTLDRDGNMESIDGWHWHESAPLEYIRWKQEQEQEEIGD